METSISPAAQAVRIPLDQIMGRLHQYSRISFSATDTLPITIETNEAGLQALIDALSAAALRAAADRTEADSIWGGHLEHTGVRWAAEQWRAIAAELEAHHG